MEMLMPCHVFLAANVVNCVTLKWKRRSSPEEQDGLPEIAAVAVLDGIQSLSVRTTNSFRNFQWDDPVIGYVITSMSANQRPPSDQARSCSKEAHCLLEQWDQLQMVLTQYTDAIQKIYSIKGRQMGKPLAILSSLLPCPVTLILRRRDTLNPCLNQGRETVGVRVPDQ